MVREEIGFAGLRFNGRRDERPNRNAFTSLMTARRIIEACDYNLVRSHSSFGRLRFAQHVNLSSQGQWENGLTSPRPENGEQGRSASGTAIRWDANGALV
jgi:hypothetical protein